MESMKKNRYELCNKRYTVPCVPVIIIDKLNKSAYFIEQKYK